MSRTAHARAQQSSRLRYGQLGCLSFAAAIFVTALPGSALAQTCQKDAECDDHVFCNGQERCAPGAPGADARGCTKATPPSACRPGQTCNEGMQRCIAPRTDFDGDGHASLFTLGDDCNDHDANEFPGNPEIWDASDHDEDCNPKTHGVPRRPDGSLIFGAQGRVGPVQVCSGEGYVVLDGVVGGDESFRQGSCDNGFVCLPQPSGDGLCQARPAGYRPPPVLQNIPLHDQVIDNSADNPANNRLGQSPRVPVTAKPTAKDAVPAPKTAQPPPKVVPIR